MSTNEHTKIVVDDIIKRLELPETAYEKAKERYESLGEWFSRKDSSVSVYDPHIFPQGSFRLGTAIRPLGQDEEYDLDLACKFRCGVNKNSHSQARLKELVGIELETYRTAYNIKKNIEEKHRCWRLEYQDDLRFHMDIVPCIPADEGHLERIRRIIEKTDTDKDIVTSSIKTTISITDDRLSNYKYICDDWKISNPEGYAKWFEYRMNLQYAKPSLLHERAKVDRIPLFIRRSPLQQVIQFLKRHRDNWSKDSPESKPISIIITTLATRAYSGEDNIVVALENVLGKMEGMVLPTKPRVPNPVDPNEDFADRWYQQDSQHLNLEDNFRKWLFQAQKDFQNITSSMNAEFICKIIEKKFALQLNQTELRRRLGDGINQTTMPKTHTIDRKTTPKPWRK